MAKIIAGGRFARFDDGTCWPIPSEAMGEVAWKLAHGNPAEVRLIAAAVINAYAELVSLPQRARQRRVMHLREAARAANSEFPVFDPDTLLPRSERRSDLRPLPNNQD